VRQKQPLGSFVPKGCVAHRTWCTAAGGPGQVLAPGLKSQHPDGVRAESPATSFLFALLDVLRLPGDLALAFFWPKFFITERWKWPGKFAQPVRPARCLVFFHPEIHSANGKCPGTLGGGRIKGESAPASNPQARILAQSSYASQWSAGLRKAQLGSERGRGVKQRLGGGVVT